MFLYLLDGFEGATSLSGRVGKEISRVYTTFFLISVSLFNIGLEPILVIFFHDTLTSFGQAVSGIVEV